MAPQDEPTESLPGSSFTHGISEGPLPWSHENFDSPGNGGERLTFALFADLTGGERPGVFDVAVEQLNLLRPELIVNVGDLIEGDSDDPAVLASQWDAFDERARRARAPIFYVGGNHDLTGQALRGVWAEEAVEIYRTEGPEAFAATEYATMPERTAGTIGAEQSAYFVDAIAANADALWTFILTHKPAWQRDGEQNFAAIEAALANRPYTVFSGHVQAYGYEERHGRDYIQLATTGGLQFPDLGRSADHVTLVTVDGDGVDIASLLLDGILDRTGAIPGRGDTLCFEAAKCGG
jgi:hypothetical protein